MRGDILVDLRNVYLPELAEAAGFSYSGVGRGALRKSEQREVGTRSDPRVVVVR